MVLSRSLTDISTNSKGPSGSENEEILLCDVDSPPVPGLVAGLGGDALAPSPGDAGGDVGPRHPGAPRPRVRDVREEGVPIKDAVVTMKVEGGKQRVMERFTKWIMAIEEVLEKIERIRWREREAPVVVVTRRRVPPV